MAVIQAVGGEGHVRVDYFQKQPVQNIFDQQEFFLSHFPGRIGFVEGIDRGFLLVTFPSGPALFGQGENSMARFR